ncbi:hypothetical protein HME9304_03038 [Flagellimonas maritima]|uniref:Lipoprotein n=1 Tax=Flagellimonas maritima TaxID=1383885 RepID=A0A2Z4LW09_9FLAO|nr:DUF6146 family protein [Allomuricauda aurantiaca]AWX46006.1 hypothetical protein HME9304_03038 [Allomuricauda aurantiaca]
MKRKELRKIIIFLLIPIIVVSCSTHKEAIKVSEDEQAYFDMEEGEAVEIKDEESEYEIIILEPGFNAWLLSVAQPEGYYSQNFLENRNDILVINWNQRVMQPQLFDPNLYIFQIDYDPNIDYGYEVNYKLYNYFIYFQRKYNQRLGPFFPRI